MVACRILIPLESTSPTRPLLEWVHLPMVSLSVQLQCEKTVCRVSLGVGSGAIPACELSRSPRPPPLLYSLVTLLSRDWPHPSSPVDKCIPTSTRPIPHSSTQKMQRLGQIEPWRYVNPCTLACCCPSRHDVPPPAQRTQQASPHCIT